MKISTKPYKGARDFYPEDKQRQKWLFNTWRNVVERFGYQEYDAPILEPTDLFLLKGNKEIVNEQTYTFKDRGERSVTIRTEMTPTVSRMVAGRRQELAYPLRWYSIPNMWRYERMQKGRLREFWQLNIDLFGVSSVMAELEMLQIIDGLFQAFSVRRDNYSISLNSRLLVKQLVTKIYGLTEQKYEEVVRLVDRKAKMSSAEFDDELRKLAGAKATELTKLFSCTSLDDLPEDVQDTKSVKDLRELIKLCASQGISNVVFDIKLMRGFDYYTDIVFEAFDTGGSNNRSILGGGRYDGLVGEFGAEAVSTIGFGLGDVVFMDFLESYNLLPDLRPKIDVRLILRSDSDTLANKIATDLREQGINVAIDFSDKKADKQLKMAAKSGVEHVLFIDEASTDLDIFTIKNLRNGKELKLSLERIAKLLMDSRNA